MYIVCYSLVAYYTLQPISKGNVYIKWATFVLIASIVTDEIRQVGRLTSFFTIAFASLPPRSLPATYQATFLPTNLLSYLPIHLPTHLLTYLANYLPTYLTTYLLT